MIKTILFDAANTLIYKPDLPERISSALKKHGHLPDAELLRSRHKLVSEIISFPDRTDKTFYTTFNSELLLALGIIPEQELLDDIFNACTYLPWHSFEDCAALTSLSLPKSVLSNFNSGLRDLLDQLLPGSFDTFIVSENAGCRKPDVAFYKLAIGQLNVEPQEILYFGDSLKLDIIPARKTGMQAVLIDRFDDFPTFKDRIRSFNEIPAVIDKLNKQGT